MNGMPPLRHSSVWRSIASGSSAPMSTRSRPPLVVDRAELDHPGLGHRPGVEGGDLGHVSSVVQTNRAVCLDCEMCTWSVITPCRLSQLR